MSVYFIATYDITDRQRYEQDYVPHAATTVSALGGEVVVASGSAQTLEGDASGQTVVFRFPSEDAFRNWYEGDRHAQLHRLRTATTTNRMAVLATEYPRA